MTQVRLEIKHCILSIAPAAELPAHWPHCIAPAAELPTQWPHCIAPVAEHPTHVPIIFIFRCGQLEIIKLMKF